MEEELAKTPDELVEKIQALVPEIQIRALEKGSLLFVEESNPFLQKFKQALEEMVDKGVSFAFEHGATNARYFTEIGVPCAVFGAVGGNMHAAGEWVDLESLEVAKKTLLKFLQNI